MSLLSDDLSSYLYAAIDRIDATNMQHNIWRYPLKNSFISGLKPSFPANPFHRSLPFLLSGLTYPWTPRTVYRVLSISVFIFLNPFLYFFRFWFRAVD